MVNTNDSDQGGTEVQISENVRRRIFVSLYGAVFASMLGIGIVVPLLPEYALSLGATGFGVGLIFSAFALSRALFMPFFGKHSDRGGRRKLIIIGLIFYAIISLFYLIAESVSSLVIIRFIHGISSALIFPLATACISEIAPKGGEGKYMGTFTSSVFLGSGIGPLTGGLLSEMYGINSAFIAMTLLTIIALVPVILYLPDIKGKARKSVSYKDVVFNKGLRIPLIYQLVNAFANGTVMTFIPIIALSMGELSISETGIIVSLSILLTAVAQKFLGSFADRYNRFLLIGAGAGIIGIGMIMVPFLHGFLPYLVFSLLIGIGSGISVPAMYALATVAGRETGQGVAMAMVNTIMSYGMIISPLVFGFIMDYAGISNVFYISALLIFISLFIYLNAYKKNRVMTSV